MKLWRIVLTLGMLASGAVAWVTGTTPNAVPAPVPMTAPMTDPLIQSSDLVYQGAFLPPGNAPTDAQSFNYGGTALAYYAPHDSLFMVGFAVTQLAAELNIPVITNNVATVSQLQRATFRQQLIDPLHGRRLTVDGDTGNGVDIGGIFPLGNNLIISAYTYYDGGGTQSLSHFKVSADLSQTAVTGPVQVTNGLGLAGYVFGYMIPIPTAWQSALGGPAMTGACCRAIIGRTSLGPSLTVFDPNNVGVVSPVPGTTVLGYPITHPTLGAYEGGNLYNGATSIEGAVWPEGTRSILFFGRNATTLHYCYGAGTTNQALDGLPDPDLPGVNYCYDLYDQSKGPHNYPYNTFVWAYDANDLVAVKNGSKHPWEIVPYATWGITTPFMTEVSYNAGHTPKGVAYKPSTSQIFFTEEGQEPPAGPVVHVLTVAVGTQPPADTTPPVVTLTAPVNGGTVSGSAVSITATATDNVGVANVQFAVDGVNTGVPDAVVPYAIAWDSTTVNNGSHTLSAIARDLSGNVATSTVTVTVSNVTPPPPDTTPPTVSLTSPAAGTVSGSISVAATASDNVGVVGVQFKRDGINLGSEDTSAPYAVTWDTTASTNASHTLVAVARDAAGNTTTSSPVTVTVANTVADTTPPTVSMTAPAAGTVSGSITVSATTSDNIAVVGVQFKLDGALLQAEDLVAPYSLTWDTRGVPDGSHVLKATARDAAGNSTTSSTVTVTVSNSLPDTTVPTVSVTAPADLATVSGTVSVTATAADNVAVAGVQFKLDGALLGAEDTTAPYAVSWDTLTSSNGSHTLKATARDTSGNVATSATITVTVSNATADVTPPTITITAPTNLSTVSGTTVSITATASDDVAVAGVQFLLNGTALGAEDTSAPYAIGWDSTTVANGSFTISAVAHDAALNVGTATPVTVTVNNAGDTTAPTVAFTAPTDAATVTGTISLTATASDNVAVSSVLFSVDGSAIGSADTSAPYSASLDTTTLVNGLHTLSAQARDAAGNTGTASISVTVSNVVVPPSTTGLFTVSPQVSYCRFVALDYPPDNTGGWKVQFKRNGQSFGNVDSTSPYTQTTPSVVLGTYSFTATWSKTGRTSVVHSVSASCSPTLGR